MLEEWGIHTDEWTFVVGTDGRVVARFEAFVTEQELEQALLATLDAERASATPRPLRGGTGAEAPLR